MDLYRYVSFETFIGIVQDEALTLVAPLMSWEDTYEGLIYRALKLKEGRKYILEILEREQIPNQTGILEIISHCIRCQCWSKERDSLAMWSIYSHNNRSLMLKTTHNRIKGIDDIGDIFEVNYIDAINLEEEIRSVFEKSGEIKISNMFKSKRKAFKHESEVRIFGVNKGELDPSKPIKIKVKPVNEFIEGVMVHPGAPDWYVEIINKFCDNHQINFLGKSKLYDFRLDAIQNNS